jgi:hypothetical protein
VATHDGLKIYANDAGRRPPLVDADLRELKAAWQAPLQW